MYRLMVIHTATGICRDGRRSESSDGAPAEGWRLRGTGLGRRASVFGLEDSEMSWKELDCDRTQFFNWGSFRSFSLMLSRLPKFRLVRLVKNFTNSLDCDAAAYLNRDPFS